MEIQHTPGLVVVTKDEFFAFVGPRDIVPRSEREFTTWETRDRVLVGKTTPGYANGWTDQGPAPRVYMLSPAARAAIATATGAAA